MKATRLYLSLIALVLSTFVVQSCKQENSNLPYNAKADLKIILSNMAEQEVAWNEGDLSGFMKHYWKDDSLKFIGKRGLTYGWQNTLDNYTKSYPDKNAMGRLKFTNIWADGLDSTNAYVVGKWELYRTMDTLSGHYSLLWKKMDNKWVIVADHSS